ncbi:MAG: hypothetical protein JO227_24705, partial [Acetobacteraceae bacterium]|nr:hypothetical protein [Acetobacteraceae bacterium]
MPLMQNPRRFGRSAFFALSFLTACAAAEAGTPDTGDAGFHPRSGIYGRYLAGRFAASEADPNAAADEFLRALAASPDDTELRQQAFIASVLAGRSDALDIAGQLPDNQIAQLLLANHDASAGCWRAAEDRFHSLSRQGL